MGEIADPAKQAACNARSPAGSASDLARAVVGEVDPQQPRRAANDLLELLDRVEVEPYGYSEAVAQRRREQPLPGSRADQREARQLDPYRAGRWPFADHQVERPVLHRRIEHFLDRGIEAMDLVDEQDVAVLQIGQQRGEIARLGD